MGYKVNEEGKFVIDLSPDDITVEEWEKVFYCADPNFNSLRKELHLVPALNRLLKEKEKDYLYQLASRNL